MIKLLSPTLDNILEEAGLPLYFCYKINIFILNHQFSIESFIVFSVGYLVARETRLDLKPLRHVQFIGGVPVRRADQSAKFIIFNTKFLVF